MVKTEWDRYYSKPYKVATYTRKITERILIKLMRCYVFTAGRGVSIAELGGGNSCFFLR